MGDRPEKNNMFKSKWVICLSGVVLVLLIVSSVLANLAMEKEQWPDIAARARGLYRQGYTKGGAVRHLMACLGID